MIATLRDSQNFVRAADEGIGICDLPLYRAKQDLVAMAEIIAWLDQGIADAPQPEAAARQAAVVVEDHVRY